MSKEPKLTLGFWNIIADRLLSIEDEVLGNNLQTGDATTTNMGTLEGEQG